MCEQWWLHCTSQWGWWTLLSENVHCVAVTFKITEWVEQWICIKFALSLNIPLWKLFGWFRRPQPQVTGDWQLHHDNMPMHHVSCRFLAKHQVTQVTQLPYSPDLSPCDLWLFPKLKSPLKGKRFQTISEIQENTTEQLITTGRTVWGPKVPTLKGTEASLSFVLWFLYLVSSSINVSLFHITWLDTFWTHLVYHIYASSNVSMT